MVSNEIIAVLAASSLLRS